VNKSKFLAIILAALLGVSACSESSDKNQEQVPLDQMAPDQLLKALRSNISDLNETQSILRQNAEVAEANSKRVDILKTEGAGLDARAAAYDETTSNHNRQAAAYIERCQNGKLPEDIYTQCLTLKQNLDMQKARLDSEVEQLSADHDAYNQKVTALNTEERERVKAVSVLLDKYRKVEQEIRDIQVRLYELSVDDEREGFSEKVRQCNTREELEDMYSCMATTWGK